MLRPAHASFGCLRRPGAPLAALVTAFIGVLPTQQVPSACRLLQVAELQAAIGGKTSTAPSGSSQSVPGMTLDECSVVLSSTSSTHPVSIRIVTNLSMDGAQALTIRNTGTASELQWKVAGARVEQGKMGNAICILTGRPHVASQTVCSIPRGKGYVEVEVTGSVDDLPSMATVGALVQKAFTRL
jgi:hypothetical protein